MYRLGFRDYSGTETERRLTVQGKIPVWLRGVFIRNGPAQFTVGHEKMRHWFDGLALLSKFTFRDQGISYLSKYIRSEAYNLASKTGQVRLAEFGTRPNLSPYAQLKSLFSSIVTDNANVNTMCVGDDLIAMTETWRQIKINFTDLTTKEQLVYKDQIKYQITTAHPHFDFKSQTIFNFAVQYGVKSKYYFIKISQDLTQEMLACVPVRHPSYVHSFCITENYIILIACPLLINPLTMLYSNTRWGKPFIENFVWTPQIGTHFYVIDKKNGEVIHQCEAESFFMFHTINAFEHRQEIILDLSGYDDAKIIDAFYLDNIADQPMNLPPVNFRRYRLPLKSGHAKYEALSKSIFEFPRIHYEKYNGRFYQYAYGASKEAQQSGFLDNLIKIDIIHAAEKIWREVDCYPGEPVFVAAPDAKKEDDGAIITIVLNAQQKKSFLLILDAASFTEIARAELPEMLPFGLHGQFYYGCSF